MFDRRSWSEARRAGLGLPLAVSANALAGLATVAQAFLLSRIVDDVFLEGKSLAALEARISALLAAIILRATLAWAGEASAGLLAVRVKTSIRQRIFRHLQRLGPTHAQGERTGELINTLMQGVEALETYFSQYLPQLIVAVLVPLTVLMVVLPVDPLSGLVLLLTAPLMPLFMVLIGAAAKRATQRQWQTLSQMSAHFLDLLQGLTTLKTLGQSRAQIGIVKQISDRFRLATMRVMRVTFLSALTLELLSTLSVAIVAVEIGLRLLRGGLAFADAFFILILAPEFYLPLRMLGARFHAGMEGASAARRVFAILGSEPQEHTSRKEAGPPPRLPGPTRFDNVHYAYQKGRRAALRGASLVIGTGERVALVGPSGSGSKRFSRYPRRHSSLRAAYRQPAGCSP